MIGFVHKNESGTYYMLCLWPGFYVGFLKLA